MPEELVRVVAAVIADGNRLLVCQRPPHKRHGGLWEFPGGKCEPGETDHAALARELSEELKVDVVNVETAEIETRDPGAPFVIAFVPVTIVGEPKCVEHTGLAWATLDELREFPLAPSDRRFAESRSSRESG